MKNDKKKFKSVVCCSCDWHLRVNYIKCGNLNAVMEDVFAEELIVDMEAFDI